MLFGEIILVGILLFPNNCFVRHYCFILHVVISVSPLSGRFLFPWFPVRSLHFIPKPLLYMSKSCSTLVFTCGTARSARLGGLGWGGGGYLGWCGGVLGLIRVFNRAYSLTCQPNSKFWISAWLPFPQGTGKPSSTDHLWIEPRNGNCDLTVYPPLYLRKGFYTFLCHESAQWREYE